MSQQETNLALEERIRMLEDRVLKLEANSVLTYHCEPVRSPAHWIQKEGTQMTPEQIKAIEAANNVVITIGKNGVMVITPKA